MSSPADEQWEAEQEALDQRRGDNCRSYNADNPEKPGTVPEVVLPRPAFMADGQRVNGVPVDACIAGVIRHLWDNGIVTLSCCCGHGGRLGKPSIVLGGQVYNYDKVTSLIAEVDKRKFDLLQWQLVKVDPKKEGIKMENHHMPGSE